MTFTAFAQTELGVTLSKGWRVVALIAWDKLEPRDLVGEDREVAREIFGDVDEIPPMARRILALLFGRESGKTLFVSAYALYVLATADISMCGPGDLPRVIVVAPSKDLAKLSVQAAHGLAMRSPRLRKRIKETPDGFTLERRDGRIVAYETRAASKGGSTVRGFTILCAVLDEAEFFASDEGGAFAVNDRDVFAGLAPRAREIILISTPWPVPTLMSEIVESNFETPTIAVVGKASTLRMRDHDPDLVMRIEAERIRDPANAAREFDADDTQSGGSSLFFDSVALNDAIHKSRPTTIAKPDGAICAAGVDLSATRDPSTCVVLGERDNFVRLLDLIELRPRTGQPLKMSKSVATFANVLGRYGLRSFVADAWGREIAREFAEPVGIKIDAAPEGRAGKVAAFLIAQKLINEGKIELPNHDRLVAQLRAVTSKPGPGGQLIIHSPRRAGSHGDLVSALVLATWALRERPVARFANPPPVFMQPVGAGFEMLDRPNVVTSPRTGAEIERDELSRWAGGAPGEAPNEAPKPSIIYLHDVPSRDGWEGF